MPGEPLESERPRTSGLDITGGLRIRLAYEERTIRARYCGESIYTDTMVIEEVNRYIGVLRQRLGFAEQWVLQWNRQQMHDAGGRRGGGGRISSAWGRVMRDDRSAYKYARLYPEGCAALRDADPRTGAILASLYGEEWAYTTSGEKLWCYTGGGGMTVGIRDLLAGGLWPPAGAPMPYGLSWPGGGEPHPQAPPPEPWDTPSALTPPTLSPPTPPATEPSWWSAVLNMFRRH